MSDSEEFTGSTKQHLTSIDDRLDRIENKLDRAIEKGLFYSTLTGGIAAVIVAVVTR